jgi:LCP family protein required for cell wall assembly
MNTTPGSGEEQQSSGTATETQPAPTPTPYADLGFELPKSMINILLLGSDRRADNSFRTDVIMMLSLDPEKGTASLISFPRDLYVSIPGVGMERVNTSQEFGGFPLTQETFKLNFGVKPGYYMLTDFNGFTGIVDTLGGIDVYAAYNLTDVCDLPQAVDKMCTIYAGQNHFDGQTALWYARSRRSTSDFDRTRRAQEVITAIFQKLMSLNAVNRAPELYDMFKTSVETNIPLTTIVPLLPLFLKIYNDPSIVKRFAIGPKEVTSYVVPESGAQVLLPIQDSVMAIMREALSQ